MQQLDSPTYTHCKENYKFLHHKAPNMYPLIMSHYVYFKNNFAMPFVLFLLLLINQRKCHYLWCHVNRNAVSFSQGGAGGLKVMKCLECLG